MYNKAFLNAVLTLQALFPRANLSHRLPAAVRGGVLRQPQHRLHRLGRLELHYKECLELAWGMRLKLGEISNQESWTCCETGECPPTELLW